MVNAVFWQSSHVFFGTTEPTRKLLEEKFQEVVKKAGHLASATEQQLVTGGAAM